MASTTSPSPARGARFWFRVYAAAHASFLPIISLGIFLLASKGPAVAVAVLVPVGFGIARLSGWAHRKHVQAQAANQEAGLLAALSTRYRVRVTRLGTAQWDVGGRVVEAILSDGPSLRVIGAEPRRPRC